MRLVHLLSVILLLVSVREVSPAEPERSKPCSECHQKEHAEFNKSRMAVAARTTAFLDEWHSKGKDVHCTECHAPSRREGIICIDCHGSGDHPYPKLEVPQICARCHDAPGEATLRSYRRSSAARHGKDCLDCHLEGGRSGHDFKGPLRAGYLDGVARLKISVRRDGGSYTALIRISHRTGHALPGGTTGRAVWLVVEELDSVGNPNHRSQFRFGWQHDPEYGWQDRTLPPGPGTVVEAPLQGGKMTSRVRATLIYRFAPGGLDRSDPDQVILDKRRFILP